LHTDASNRLRALAVRCRELAASATDPEAAKALRDIAVDIDAALPILKSVLADKEGDEG
jgi:hypothetical protein